MVSFQYPVIWQSLKPILCICCFSFFSLNCIGGQLTLDDGETLLINTTEPSALIVDSKGNRRLLAMFTENNSFTSRHGNLRQWQYGVARLVVEKDVTFTSNSNVSIYGENALSIASAAGNIIIKTNIVLSCDVTVLGGNCVGGYMPGDKPNNWFSTVIPGKFTLV